MNVLKPGKFNQNKFWFYPQNQVTVFFFKIAWFVLVYPELELILTWVLN